MSMYALVDDIVWGCTTCCAAAGDVLTDIDTGSRLVVTTHHHILTNNAFIFDVISHAAGFRALEISKKFLRT